MKKLIKSILLMIALPLLISIVVWIFESRLNDTILFSEAFILWFLNIFYGSISSVVYTSVFDIKFSWHIADYVLFYYSYKWLIVFMWQFVIDFLLLYIFYFFNKTKYIYGYTVTIVILKIIFAYTIWIFLV